jgi:hypothetical protein
MQKGELLEFELDSLDNKKETDFSDLPDLISVSDDDDEVNCDVNDFHRKTFQVFSRLSTFNFGLEKVTEDINNLKKDAADITVLIQNLCILLSRRSSCGENIVLNMEENSDEGELLGEHFSSPLYTKIPSQDKRFYLEDDEQEDNDEEDNDEEEDDDEQEEEDDDEEDADVNEEDDNDDEDDLSDPNGLGKSTIFD